MKTLALATLAALALAASAPTSANAQRMSNLTGERLMRLCTSQNQTQVEGCTAYIDGIADSVAFYQRLRPADGSKGAALPAYVCIPGPTTGVQLRQSVITWYRSHQDQANRQASGIVLRALDETFICAGENHQLHPTE